MNGMIIYDTAQRQCGYIAKKLSASTGLPCVKAENVMGLEQVEALVLIKKAKYNNGTSDGLMRFVTDAKMPEVRMALIIHSCSSLLGRYHGFYYNGNGKNYISSLSMSNEASNTSMLHQTLCRKGVETVDDCLCFYSPFLLGRVCADSMLRTVRFVREALGMGRYE